MDKHQTIISTGSQETAAIGRTFAHSLVDSWENGEQPKSHILCLFGDLGSGKTTFSQGFARSLGITTRLLSPTFIIVRRYSIPNGFRYFYHIDLYRTDSTKELSGIGIEEILVDTNSCVIIEWAEKMKELMPISRYELYFSALKNGSHRILIDRSHI
jgi:tRNA threonylcarbamoyladenosine biosynthesis protein TsaE